MTISKRGKASGWISRSNLNAFRHSNSYSTRFNVPPGNSLQTPSSLFPRDRKPKHDNMFLVEDKSLGIIHSELILFYLLETCIEPKLPRRNKIMILPSTHPKQIGLHACIVLGHHHSHARLHNRLLGSMNIRCVIDHTCVDGTTQRIQTPFSCVPFMSQSIIVELQKVG